MTPPADQTPQARLAAAIDSALALTDPAERAKAINAILDVSKGPRGPELRAARKADVETLLVGRTLRAVADMIDMSHTRVDQIRQSG